MSGHIADHIGIPIVPNHLTFNNLRLGRRRHHRRAGVRIIRMTLCTTGKSSTQDSGERRNVNLIYHGLSSS